MTDDAPTLGEVVRRLDDVSRRLDEISARLEQRAAQMEGAFVRKDVFEAVQQSDAIQVRGLEGEVHSVERRLDAVDTKIDDKTRVMHARIDKLEERSRNEKWLLWTSLGAPVVLLILGALIATGSLG